MIFQRKKLFQALLLGLLVVTSAASAVSALDCSAVDCHGDFTGLANSHSPVAEGECTACHSQVQEQHPAAPGQSFELVAKGSKLCYQCHDAYGRKLFVHSPVKEGECTACHNPHGGSSGVSLLNAEHDLTAVCTGCHASEAFSGTYKHGPAASGDCSECHNPHESNQAALLKQPVQQNCSRCHTDMADGLANAPYIHSAVKGSACTECHNPHSSPAPKLLQNDLEELCLSCHGEVGRQVKKASTKHAALYREEKCSACHSTHFSQYPFLLNAPEQEVCLACHDKDDFSKSKPLKNIAKELEGKANLHGPLRDGKCSACHNPHGSSNVRLLKGSYPAGFYSPYQPGSYDFCLECHDKNLLRFAETSIYTEFRNGKRNLHFVHVANKYKGRTCRACHEAHASNADKLMTGEGAEFGDWQVPTRFIQSDTGGSCSPGCHRTYQYDRETPVVYEE